VRQLHIIKAAQAWCAQARKTTNVYVGRLPVTLLEISWGLLWTSSDVTGSLITIDIGGFGLPDLPILIVALHIIYIGKKQGIKMSW
jgi:hypothetical protein